MNQAQSSPAALELLFTFGWMNTHGFDDAAQTVCTAMVDCFGIQAGLHQRNDEREYTGLVFGFAWLAFAPQETGMPVNQETRYHDHPAFDGDSEGF